MRKEPGTLVLIDPMRQADRPGSAGRLALFLLCLLPLQGVPAQTSQELRYLIFEPVAIDYEPGPSPEAPPRVTELTSLPAGPGAAEPGDLVQQRRPDSAAPVSEPAEEEADQAAAEYERSIRGLELEGGPYEARLVQELMALGTAHQERGEHARAIEAFERAWHINRVNNGLFNLEQSPIISRMIDSHVAIGNLLTADEQQEYLFYIQQKTHGSNSPKLLPALISLADWNIFAFNVRLGPNSARSFAEENEYAGTGVTVPFDLEDFRTRRLVNAQNLYRAVIKIVTEHHGVDDPRLLEAEEKLVLANYFFATNYNIASSAFQNASGGFIMPSTQPAGLDLSYVSSNSMGYRHGRDALERRVGYLRRQEENADPRALAGALVDLGDWQLMFKKRISGIEAYQEAQRVLAGEDTPAARRLLAPAIPVTLPTFVAGSYTRGLHRIPDDRPLKYRGHIDMAFSLNRYGLPGDIEVLGSAGEASEAVESRLVRHIRRSQFRPRFSGPEPRDDDRMRLRYYFSW